MASAEQYSGRRFLVENQERMNAGFVNSNSIDKALDVATMWATTIRLACLVNYVFGSNSDVGEDRGKAPGDYELLHAGTQ